MLRDDVEDPVESRVVHRVGHETELVEAMKRIYYFSKRIARLVVEEPAPYSREHPTGALPKVPPRSARED